MLPGSRVQRSVESQRDTFGKLRDSLAVRVPRHRQGKFVATEPRGGTRSRS